MADPVVMRSMDRLSATVNRQRTSLAASLNLLEDELKTFVDKPPSNELQALQAALAAAKKHESTKSSSAEAQRMRVELGLANDEVTRLASQVRSLELRLKSRDDSEVELAAAESELERRARAHEVALEGHRRTERKLAQSLADAEKKLGRAQESGDDARERSRAAELASQVAMLERQAATQKRLTSSLEEEVDELRAEKKGWLAESVRMEEAAAVEISRGSDLRAKLAEERNARRRLETELKEAQQRLGADGAGTPRPKMKPRANAPAMAAAAAMAAEVDDDDDDTLRALPQRAPPQPSKTVASALALAARPSEDVEGDPAEEELRIIGTLAPGMRVNLVLVAGDERHAGRAIDRGANVQWFRVKRSPESSNTLAAVVGERVTGKHATGGSYLCSSEDVGYALRAEWTNRSVMSASPVVPQHQTITLLLKAEKDEMFEHAVEDATGRELTLSLSKRKIELLDPDAVIAAASTANTKRNKATKSVIVQSQSWSKGVAMTFIDGEVEFTLQLASKAKKRPPPIKLSTSTRPQRDLVMLAMASFYKPSWLLKVQTGMPPDLSFLTLPPSGEASSSAGPGEDGLSEKSGSEASSAATDSSKTKRGSIKSLGRALSFGLGRKKS